MTINEVLSRYNFLSKLVLKNGEEELSKDLKVKIISARIEYGKPQKAFDADVQEFISASQTDRFKELQGKQEKTDEEKEEFEKLVNKVNSEVNTYVINRANEPYEGSTITFTPEEIAEIITVNCDNEVVINNQTIPPADFLEIFSTMFS